MNTFRNRFKVLGVLAIVVGIQVLASRLGAVASTPDHQPQLAHRLAAIAASATSPHPDRLSEDTYTPPDNGGPSSTQGSGTR